MPHETGSPDFYRAVFDAAPQSIVTIDAQGIVRDANPATERIFGFTNDELVGRNVANTIVDGLHVQMHDSYLQNYHSTGVAKIIGTGREVFGRRKDGSRVPIHLTVSRWDDDCGRVWFTAVMVDLTRLHEAEFRAKRGDERFNDMVAAMPIPCVCLSSAGVVLYANSSAGEYLGFDPSASIGQSYLTRIRLRLEEVSTDAVAAAIAFSHQESLTPEWKTPCLALRPDGSRATCDVHAVAIDGLHGRMVCLFLHDTRLHMEQRNRLETLTKRLKERNSALRHAKQEARESSFRKSEVLANMSHEIRNPMTGILGALSLLGKAQLEPGAAKWVTLAHDSATNLLTLLNDILDLSRIESGGVSLSSEDFHLPTLLDEVVSLNAIKSRDKRIVLSVEYDVTVGEWFHGDQGRVRQVINNLVNNAVKFTVDGGVTVRVTSDHSSLAEPQAGKNHSQLHSHGFEAPPPPEGKRLLMEIVDTGCGIAAEELLTVFHRHSETATTKRSPQAGAGLGLPISRSLAHLLGGEIEMVSTVDRGTTARFTLVLPQLDGEAACATNESHVKVLIASECRLTLKSLVGTIASTGAFTETAVRLQDVVSACAAAQENGMPFDAVVVDSSWQPGAAVTPRGLSLLVTECSRLGASVLLVVEDLDSVGTANQAALETIGKPVSISKLLKALRKIGKSSSVQSISNLRPSRPDTVEDERPFGYDPSSHRCKDGGFSCGTCAALNVAPTTAEFVLQSLPEHLAVLQDYIEGKAVDNLQAHIERASHFMTLMSLNSAAFSCQRAASLIRQGTMESECRKVLAAAVTEGMSTLPRLLEIRRSGITSQSSALSTTSDHQSVFGSEL